MHKKLFIPGPVDVADDVLQAMATPMISHRSKAATELQKACHDKVQKVFQTDKTILFSTSSGTGLMEAAVRCLTKKKAAVFSVGAFGNRWFELAVGNGVAADKFESVWGEPTTPEMVDKALATGQYDLITVTHNETSTGIQNPIGEIAEVMKKYPDVMFALDTVSSMAGANIPVDKWNIDCCITSSQKAFALPPGLAMCSVSERAIERARTVPNRGVYFDLVELYKFVKEKHQYPSTPSLSHLYALNYRLDKMLAKGMDKVWADHLEMANWTRAWANEYFKIFPNDLKYASNTLSTIKNTRNLDVKMLHAELAKVGYEFSNGYGKLADVTFRIAHMGMIDIPQLKELTGHIERIWKLK